MVLHTGTDQLKACCAAFYEQPVLKALFGDILHPGGLRATTHLGRLLDLTPSDDVLDVACGPGRSARHHMRTFGCRVIGLDYSWRSMREAQRSAGGSGYFLVGDGERLPFADGRFDAVTIECSLCLFSQKGAALREMYRVLKPGGRIGIADLALEQPLPSAWDHLAVWVACVAGACTTEGYRQSLRHAEFADVVVEDASWALADLAQQIGERLFLLDVASGLGKLSLPVAPSEALAWLAEARRWIADGRARYILMTGRRPEGPSHPSGLEDGTRQPEPVGDEIEPRPHQEQRAHPVHIGGDEAQEPSHRSPEERGPDGHGHKDRPHPQGVADELGEGVGQPSARQGCAHHQQEDGQGTAQRSDRVSHAKEEDVSKIPSGGHDCSVGRRDPEGPSCQEQPEA